jgi:hypothetical protein
MPSMGSISFSEYTTRVFYVKADITYRTLIIKIGGMITIEIDNTDQQILDD